MARRHPVIPAEPVVVTLPAEIDLTNAGSAYREIAAEFARGAQVVVADMTATTFCDTMSIRALVLAYWQAAAIGADLQLVVPCPRVLRVMGILGVDAVLPLYHSLDEALTGVGSRSRNRGPAHLDR